MHSDSIAPFSTRQDAVIWAAGFFDGEGCVSVVHQRRSVEQDYYRAVVRVSQVRQAPLLILRALWGGVIYPYRKKGNTQLSYNWYLNRQSEMLQFCRDVSPYLCVKGLHVELLAAYCGLAVGMGGRVSAWNSARREEIRSRLQRLNLRGVVAETSERGEFVPLSTSHVDPQLALFESCE